MVGATGASATCEHRPPPSKPKVYNCFPPKRHTGRCDGWRTKEGHVLLHRNGGSLPIHGSFHAVCKLEFASLCLFSRPCILAAPATLPRNPPQTLELAGEPPTRLQLDTPTIIISCVLRQQRCLARQHEVCSPVAIASEFVPFPRAQATDTLALPPRISSRFVQGSC